MSADVCGFALHRGRFCMRPAGHEATDGRVPRHDSTGMPAKPYPSCLPSLGESCGNCHRCTPPEIEETP